MRHVITWLPVGVLLGVACAGCSATAVDGYERADRLAVARDEFNYRKAQCERIGGSMSMRTHPLQPPGLTEYRSATCVKR